MPTNDVSVNNSYLTSIILGAINFGSTLLGLYVVDHFGRRKSLIVGAVWMFACFMIFASAGHFLLEPQNEAGQSTYTAGIVMIVFTCLFIFGYATTWGPIIWALVGEIFPSRYRAKSMGLATSANWTFNFLISFFTPYITGAIDYRYGYLFAACNVAGALTVFFFVPESQGRTLEEIDTMYVAHVTPWKSKYWQPPLGQELGEKDAAYSSPEDGGVKKHPGLVGPEGETEEREENVGTV